MKIVICGGHHNSALVLAEKLCQEGNQIFWFGHKYSMIGDKNPSAEFLEVNRKGIPFIEIKAGKYQPSYRFWRYFFRIPLGFWQSWRALRKTKPDLIISFGGYLALPVVICGWLQGTPSVTHEQTTISGLANKVIAKFSKKIFVSFPSSLTYFPREKTVLTGLPVREEIFKKGEKLFSNSQKTIYIFGGKQGSHILNEKVFEILPQLLGEFNIIHQCGSTSITNDFQKAEQLKCSLGAKADNYLVKEYFFDSEIGQIYGSADFVIARAGAHTVYELALLNKPAILIPLPWSTGGEQQKNAEMLEKAGLAKVLSQNDLEAGKLWQTVQSFSKNLKKYVLKKTFSLPTDATERIIDEIKKIKK